MTDSNLRQDLSRPDLVWTYEDVARRAEEVRTVLQERGVRIHRDSALSVTLRQAQRLADGWKDASGDPVAGIKMLIGGSDANRVADAVLAVREDADALDCLKRMAGNPVDLSSRSPSQGKDALWELELLALLRRRGATARLLDPPDIIANIGFGDYAIACKKVYSEKGVEAQVRKGARQVAASGMDGIVAINIDDLAPAQSIIEARTRQQASDRMASFIAAFIDSHRMHIQRFVKDGRCDAIFVSVTVPVDVELSRPRFSSLVQMTVWTLDETSDATRERLRSMRSFFGELLG